MRALSFSITIGGLNLSSNCVKSFEMDRNFSDVANKFSITLIDNPRSNMEAFNNTTNGRELFMNYYTTDLEILINEGHRGIDFSYCDNNGPSEYQSFSGTIWDYDSTFVGNIKELTITGYASKSTKTESNGEFYYNIDWNNYYNRRADETALWNGLALYSFKAQHTYQWEYEQALKSDDSQSFLNSMISYGDTFLDKYNQNSLYVNIKGPVGTIKVPIPDSFTEMVPHRHPLNDDGEEDEDVDVGDALDPDKKFWGKLTDLSLKDYVLAMNGVNDSVSVANDIKKKILKGVDPTLLGSIADKDIVVYVDKDNKIRGFSVDGGQTGFIQMNPKKSYYGAGQLLTTSTGVNISHIVEQLAILEGWEIGYIVPTELVPCSDKFKMQAQTAKQFINDVLIPLSITPVGNYRVNETFIANNGKTNNGKDRLVEHSKNTVFTIDKGQSGFTLYWKDGKVYYEPISSALYRTIHGGSKNIKFGYNVPNSPVISFKVNTKGTAFFTNDTNITAMEIATGQQINTVITTDKSSVENYNKSKGHNEALDRYFGYNYEYVRSKWGDSSTSNFGWVGLKDATAGSQASTFNSQSAQAGLVNRLATSAITDLEKYATAEEVRTRIKEFTIQATMNLWGDSSISPNSIIEVTNMIKSDSRDVTEVHPTSGKYLITKQRDTFDGSQYLQQLTMFRADKLQLNNYNVDWRSLQKVKENLKLKKSDVFNGKPERTMKDVSLPKFDIDSKGKTLDFNNDSKDYLKTREEWAYYRKINPKGE